MTQDLPDPTLGPPSGGAQGVTADLKVRAARATDAPAVGEVQAQVFRATYADVLPSAVVASFDGHRFASAWRQSLRTPPDGDHRLYVACVDDRVVGFTAVGPATDPDAGERDAELLVGGVAPEHRGHGHGARLLNAAVTGLRDAGWGGVLVWVPDGDPGEALRDFLTKAGLMADGAVRERVVDEDDRVLGETRFAADLVPAGDTA